MSANPKVQIDRDEELRVLRGEMRYLRDALARAKASEFEGYAYAYGRLQEAVKIALEAVAARGVAL